MLCCRCLGQVSIHAWFRVDPPSGHRRKGRVLLLPLLHRGLPTHQWLLPTTPPVAEGPPRHIPHGRSKPDASHLWRQRQGVALLLPRPEHNRWTVGGERDGSAASYEGEPRSCYSGRCGSVRDRGRRNIDRNHRVSSDWKPRVGTGTSTPC